MGCAVKGRLFCFGLGYVARALAHQLRAEGWSVAGTTRDPSGRLAPDGVEIHRFDGTHPLDDPARTLAGTTHILTSVPPGEDGDPVLRHHGRDLLGLSELEWAGYLGTTGIYGDQGGAWVSESDPPSPTSLRTRRRVAAEGHWLASGLPAHVFRLAGIYGPGPGRNALESVRSGTARRIVKPGQVFGRIHVDDIVQVLRASMAKPNPGAIYNVADDLPAPPQNVIAFAAELLGVAPPPAVAFEEADLSPMARSFYADCRRVANGRIKQELGVELRHPTYREGLRAILAAETADADRPSNHGVEAS
jgi:nucleoside-diphosphate-sugar epimerase